MHYFFLLPSLLLSLTLTAQLDDGPAMAGDSLGELSDTTIYPFVAYWSVGDTYTYEITKIENREHNGELTKADTNIYRSSLEVLDSTVDSYLIRYTFGDQLKSTQTDLPEEIVASMADLPALQSITYRTNELGTFERLENWQGFATAMDSLFEQVLVLLKDESVPDSLLRRALQPMRNMYTSEAGILNKIISEIAVLHSPFGYEYRVGDTLLYNIPIANLIGDRPIDTENVLYVEDTDWAEDYIELRHFTNLTPDGAEAMVELITQAFPGITDSPEMQEVLATTTVTLNDDNWSAYYNYPGIPVMIDNDRLVVIQFGEDEERLITKLVVRWVD